MSGMALFTIEWQISQHLFGVDGINWPWDQVVEHFLKICKGFACL